jgi:DMSO reductase iron-sulfur subunit
MQRAFTLDINKCTGCEACRVACTIENQLVPGTSWRWVDTFNDRHHPEIPLFHLSLACNHCLHPPCVRHCPTLAFSKDPETGLVTVDEESCIGCRYCTWACPYDSPQFDAASGVVKKCTFCDHRLAERKEPACVALCPTGALQVADLQESTGAVSVPGFPQTDAEPAIRFLTMRREPPYPKSTSPPSSTSVEDLRSRAASKVALRSEWSLIAFTLLVALLVGWIAGLDAGAGLSAPIFLGLSAAGAVLSTLHLGRRLQAFRSIANWRQSWLSREIILFLLFVSFATAHLLTGGDASVARWLAMIAGFGALIAVDRVYAATRTPKLHLHSAQVLLTGLLVLGIAASAEPVFLTVGVVKVILYLYRKFGPGKRGHGMRPWISVARVVLGFLIPGGLWLADPTSSVGLALSSLAVGEIIDRCEYYVELEVSTPRRQMAMALADALRRG